MSNVEQLQYATRDFGDATASVHNFATSIAKAHADFIKQLVQHNSDYFSQLTSVREPAKLMELQTEYTKNTYETLVAEAKTISELYTGFFKQTTKPLEALIAKSRSS